MAVRPNIILIMTDQQRFDTIGAWGCNYMTTPAQDRLVREGLSFRNDLYPDYKGQRPDMPEDLRKQWPDFIPFCQEMYLKIQRARTPKIPLTKINAKASPPHSRGVRIASKSVVKKELAASMG